MDFTFSPEQEALRDAVRAFLGAEAPGEYVRRMAEHDDTGVTPDVWRKIVDLGWTGLLVPESAGGLGLGLIDAVVVQEEMGRGVFPGPFFSSAILATLAARALGLDEQLAALAAGTQRGHGRARRSRLRRPDGAGARARRRPRHPVQARRREADGPGRAARPTGCSCPPRTREGLQTFLVDRPANAEPVASLDVTRKFARMEFSDDARDARSVRPATTPTSGAASSTTRAC